jgi:syntaxin 7
VQRSALEKQRSSARAARTALEEQNEQQSQQASSDGGQYGGQQQQQQQQQQQEQDQLRLAPQDEVDFQDSLIVERETQIRHIEQSVGELNELFRDVAHIVAEQGEQLDLIADNVQNVRNDTHGADRELRSASKYQKKARNRACCLLLILSIVLAVILLAVFLG